MTTAYNVYLEAKIDHEILEQKIKQCQNAVLLPGMNYLFEQSAAVVESYFWAWCDEVDKLLLNQPISEIPVTRLNVVAGWWDDDCINQTPGAA